MFYKILDGGIFAAKYFFDKSRFTLPTCDIKTFQDLTMKTIGLDKQAITISKAIKP
jgi:hypothetical protein